MNKIFKIIVLLGLFAALFYIIYASEIIREIVYIIFIGFIIAYTLKPINKYLVRRGIKKELGALLLLLGISITLIITTIFLVPLIFKESLRANVTSSEIQQYVIIINSKLEAISKNPAGGKILITLYNRLDSELKNLLSRIVDWSVDLGGNLLGLAIVPIISYYFLADGDSIKNKILVIFPTKWRSVIRKMSEDIDKSLSRYMISQFILSIIVGILTFLTLVILKVNYPIMLSVLNAVFNVIPYFGPVFGAIPAIVIAFLKSPKEALWTALWLYIIQIIEGNIISPRVTGESVSMHPMLVIILLIIGDKIGGFVGMIIVIPIAVVIKVIYEDLNYYLY